MDHAMSIKGVLYTLAFFGIVGLMLMIWGGLDYMESRNASPEPRVVELADLEKNPTIEGNNHVQIKEHAACYYALVYAARKKRFTKVDQNTSLTECYYPIVSSSNPAIEKI